MLPAASAIARVMAETGFGEAQAISHLRLRQKARDAVNVRRRIAAQPRRFTTEPSPYRVAPYSPEAPLNRTLLRCYGQGRCTLGEGVPMHYATAAEAERAGRIWCDEGIAPADQRF